MKNRCVEIFSAVPRCFNCAQAIAVGFGRDELAAVLQNSGGGRAPGNRCGALHAAMLIAGVPDAEALRNEFVSGLGSESCSELKQKLQIPCTRCVEFAAELLEKYQSGK